MLFEQVEIADSHICKSRFPSGFQAPLMTTGLVTNETNGATAQAQPLSDYVMTILESGGIKPLIKKQYGQNG